MSRINCVKCSVLQGPHSIDLHQLGSLGDMLPKHRGPEFIDYVSSVSLATIISQPTATILPEHFNGRDPCEAQLGDSDMHGRY